MGKFLFSLPPALLQRAPLPRKKPLLTRSLPLKILVILTTIGQCQCDERVTYTRSTVFSSVRV